MGEGKSKDKCGSCKDWFCRLSFFFVLGMLGLMTVILNWVLKEPLITTLKYRGVFNILFVLFLFPMCGLTLQAVTSYAKHKKLCRCKIFSFFVLTLIILAVTGMESKMIYKARNKMKADLKAPCNSK
jgi:uncharacterized membrane protein